MCGRIQRGLPDGWVDGDGCDGFVDGGWAPPAGNANFASVSTFSNVFCWAVTRSDGPMNRTNQNMSPCDVSATICFFAGSPPCAGPSKSKAKPCVPATVMLRAWWALGSVVGSSPTCLRQRLMFSMGCPTELGGKRETMTSPFLPSASTSSVCTRIGRRLRGAVVVARVIVPVVRIVRGFLRGRFGLRHRQLRLRVAIGVGGHAGVALELERADERVEVWLLLLHDVRGPLELEEPRQR